MFTKIQYLLVMTLIGFVSMAGCGDEDTTGPEDPADSITINSITPSSGLAPGVDTNFVVTVEYVLATLDSGQLMIGFNTSEVGSFAMLSGASFVVAKGSGEHTFNVSAAPVNWGAAGDFKVYVNLSENPHGPVWTPLATDTQVLTLN